MDENLIVYVARCCILLFFSISVIHQLNTFIPSLDVKWNILVDNKKTSLTFSNESESKPWKNYLFDNFILIDWGSMQSIGEVFGSVPNLVAYVNIYLVD